MVQGRQVCGNLQGESRRLVGSLSSDSYAQMTDVFEGSLIRMFKRLQELIRQMGQAAHAIGNVELEEKFGKSLELLERPNTVVFNPSYVMRMMFWSETLTAQIVFVVHYTCISLQPVPCT